MEYEWEYAARAGKAGDLYAGSNLLELVGWFDANANQQVQALKLKHPNQWNIYDMCGDVWEWCHEVYVQQTVHINADLYEKNPNAPWSDRTKERILKGGDFLSEADKCLITHRMIKDREQYVNLKSGAAYGMRVVKPI
jgi:formylglycine-generating enzyme required for sulfatase activity